ncbi:MAG TPA: nuclear transport factor 2 family protein [Thermomicrobiaceae bacterium]|nr:nuclear transport factor 2 family protein [Thermomicrobiaceae bacterium]
MEERPTAPAEVVAASIAALNRGDVEDALAYCADAIVLWAPGRELAGQEVRGKETLRLVLEHSEARWPDLWTAVRSVVSAGERVAVELTIVATEGGVRLSQPAAAFYVVRDGLIVEQANYYDLGALSRMLIR